MAAGPGQGKLRPHYRLILYDLIGIRSIEKMYMNQEVWGLPAEMKREIGDRTGG
jgi:hypothetical protein